MHATLALLYVGGLTGAALSLRATARTETARRGYLYAAASGALFTTLLAVGLIA
ncbi:MAG TPA: hypothetical protein VD860_02920 [Azospirillum sp.]|nr:hypothetical protein [Azospirillum sp.]